MIQAHRQKPKLLIVGNGMAAGRLVEEIRKRDPEAYAITLIGEEPQGSYNRILLSSVLAGDQVPEQIIQQDTAWYQSRGIRFLGGVRATAINPQQKQVILENGSSENYDELVIATGSRSATIPAGNQQLEAIFSFRTLDDVNAIEHSCTKARRALVVGGGLLGLEAAYGLAQKGIQVTLVHRGDWLLNRQLDPTAGEVLRQRMATMNIDFRLSDEVESFTGSSRVTGAILKSGEPLDCDLALIATGISPNMELAGKSDIHTEQAIVVDELMRTSAAHISALGECCEFQGNRFGLVAPIWDQCISLADRLVCGIHQPFAIQPIATKLKVSGVQLFSAGEYLTRPHHRELVMHDPGAGIYRKLLLDGDQLVGAVLFGDTRDGNWYFELIQNQQDLRGFLPAQLVFGRAYCPDSPPEQPIDQQTAA